MSGQWQNIYVPRIYLGRMTEKGYYIQIPGGNWFIIVPTKLVRMNEDADYFILTTKPDFIYTAVEKKKDSSGTIQQTSDGKLTGKDIIETFKIN